MVPSASFPFRCPGPKMKTDVENQLHIKCCSCGNLIVATASPSICHFATRFDLRQVSPSVSTRLRGCRRSSVPFRCLIFANNNTLIWLFFHLFGQTHIVPGLRTQHIYIHINNMSLFAHTGGDICWQLRLGTWSSSRGHLPTAARN